MRVAIFFDGKNFYAGMRDTAARGARLNFAKIADWLVSRTSGSLLWGAYYYTGIETGEAAQSDAQRRLNSFLGMLEVVPGYFVYRFPRKRGSHRCAHCEQINSFTQEKEVDTTMVADMLRLAAVNAFDVLVLVSGDADLAPAVEGVRAVGKQAFVATWGDLGLAKRLRNAAFDHIDLLEGLDHFRAEDASSPSGLGPAASKDDGPLEPKARPGGDYDSGNFPAVPANDIRSIFISELKRAEVHFTRRGGFVGANFFVTRWQSGTLDANPEVRRRVMSQLVDDGLIEIYEAEQGQRGVRTKAD